MPFFSMHDTKAAWPFTVVVVVDGPLTTLVDPPQAAVRLARVTAARARSPGAPNRGGETENW